MASPRCPSCTDTGTKACVGCKSVKYCSEECQQADWPFHRAFCKHFKNLSPRPSPHHNLIIVFAPNSTEPSLQWVDSRDRTSRLNKFNDDKILSHTVLTYNRITGAETGIDVFLYYDDNFLDSYPEFSDSIAAITGGKLRHLWGGPIVVACGLETGGGYLGPMKDVDGVVCTDLAAYFIDCWNPSEEHKKRMARKENWNGKVQAVKATCAGERALSGAAEYVPVQIPIMHPIFEDGEADVAGVSKAIDIPLLTWKGPHKKAWPAVNQRTAVPKVCHMHKGLDPTVAGRGITQTQNSYGYSPLKWDQRLGNVIVMREDLEPLTPEFVDAFGDFCWRHLPCYFQLRFERLDDVSRERVRELEGMIARESTPENWEVYLEDWRKVKAGVLDDSEVNTRVDGKVRMGVTAADANTLEYHLLCEHK